MHPDLDLGAPGLQSEVVTSRHSFEGLQLDQRTEFRFKVLYVDLLIPMF